MQGLANLSYLEASAQATQPGLSMAFKLVSVPRGSASGTDYIDLQSLGLLLWGSCVSLHHTQAAAVFHIPKCQDYMKNLSKNLVCFCSQQLQCTKIL